MTPREPEPPPEDAGRAPGPQASDVRTRVMHRPRRERRPRVARRRSAPPGGPWPWLAALLLLVLGGLAAAYLLTRDGDEGGSGGTTASLVSVPGVVGFSRRQAVRQARNAGLRPRIRRVTADQSVGTVVNQRPAAGVEVRRGSTLVLNVSRGAPPVEVPVLTGITENEAKVRLTVAELEPSVVRVPSPKPEGDVVAQNPAPGTRVEEGTTVRINVSRGPPPPATTATTATTTATTTTTVTTAPAPPPPPPRPGSAPLVRVPNVVGGDLSRAIGELSSAGLLFNPIPVSSDEPAGTVISQRPKAGARVRQRTVVELEVAAS